MISNNVLFCSVIFALIVSGVVGVNYADAETLKINKFQVTNTLEWKSAPIIGVDSLGKYVAYTSHEITSSKIGTGDIMLQRVNNVSEGAPLRISSDMTDDVLNGAFGDYVVYTSYYDTSSYIGSIFLYQISTGQLTELVNDELIFDAKASDGKIVWVQGGINESLILKIELDESGIVSSPRLVGQTDSVSNEIEIGDRYVVWQSHQNNQVDILGYDLETKTLVTVSADPNYDELHPSTSGDWVTYEIFDNSYSGNRIGAINMNTGEIKTIIDNNTDNFDPSIDGNLVVFSSNTNDDFDLFVYDLIDDKSYEINHISDQLSSNVFDNQIAFVDIQNENNDIFVISLSN